MAYGINNNIIIDKQSLLFEGINNKIYTITKG